MSHFEDVDGLVLAGPVGVIGLIIAIVAIIWAICADHSSSNLCKEHGETYVDSRLEYTLCQNDAGVVINRK